VTSYTERYHEDAANGPVTVLPPVPTANLGTAGVNDLANELRDQMLDTLREMSAQVPGHSEQPEAPSLPVPGESKAVDPAEHDADEPTSELAQESGESYMTNSAASTRIRTEGSENGTETEEDEGMVLVGRPL